MTRMLFQIYYNEETNRLGQNPVSTCSQLFCTWPLQKDLLKHDKKHNSEMNFYLRLKKMEMSGQMTSIDTFHLYASKQ